MDFKNKKFDFKNFEQSEPQGKTQDCGKDNGCLLIYERFDCFDGTNSYCIKSSFISSAILNLNLKFL